MNINFNFHGSLYSADIWRKDDKKLVVELPDDLEKQFGKTHPFYVENNSVGFDIHNLCHSALYELNSCISKAIEEQCEEIL